MSIIDLIFLSSSLAMDAFAVSITEGARQPHIRYQYVCKAALLFGVFQAIMPVIGFWAGRTVYVFIPHIAYWVATGLLCFIGFRMALSACREKDVAHVAVPANTRTLLLLAFATSIDALAAGITLAIHHANIALSAVVIGVVTFIFCFMGVLLGRRLGWVLQKHAEIAGGIVLILLGIKILLEHLR